MNDVDKLLITLNLKLDNPKQLELAFIHRSYLNENKAFNQSNERLEFLGDSILSFLTSSYLYEKFPHIPEGELTNLRSSMVKTITLAKVAQTLELGSYLLLSRGEEEGGGRKNPSILADTFEALLGIIYLQKGLPTVKKILESRLYPLLDKILEDKAYKDAKSMFQELIQEQKRVSPVYKVISATGPDHSKEFTIGVYVDDILYGKGSGKSKQEGETMAAKAALEKWKQK